MKLQKEIDFDERSNDNLIRINALLQTMIIVYVKDIDNIMDELSNITNIIEIKYAFLKSYLEVLFESKKIGRMA